MRSTDKVYKVRVVTQKEMFILRVPKGVEINQEILENSCYLEEWKNQEYVNVSFSEVDKELWVEHKHPILEKDGDITFDY